MTGAAATVLAIGAAGKFAGLVVPELARRGVCVRGFVRNLGQGDAVRAAGAADIAVGDLRDRTSLDAALRGIDAVFYIAPAFMPDEADAGIGMIGAAKQAGVRRFVFSSVIHPSLTALANHSAKAPVEAAILESGMDYVILQPAMFFQNLARGWPAVAKSGVFAEPWSAETRFSRVDYRDVAETAALALLDSGLLYGTYELSSAGRLNRHDVARLMCKTLGRPVRAARSSPPPDAGETGIGAMFRWYDSHGLMGNPLALRAILGREPRTLATYLNELACGHGTSWNASAAGMREARHG